MGDFFKWFMLFTAFLAVVSVLERRFNSKTDNLLAAGCVMMKKDPQPKKIVLDGATYVVVPNQSTSDGDWYCLKRIEE